MPGKPRKSGVTPAGSRTPKSPKSPRSPKSPQTPKLSKQPFSPATIARRTELVRGLCMRMPGAAERLSHGEPTFFVGRRVFAMMSTNHHGDGRLSVVLPVEPGLQAIMIAKDPSIYYCPPYVGKMGWVGVELGEVGRAELMDLIEGAWAMVAPARAVAAWREARQS